MLADLSNATVFSVGLHNGLLKSEVSYKFVNITAHSETLL